MARKKSKSKTKLGDRVLPKFEAERVFVDEDGEDAHEFVTLDPDSDLDVNTAAISDELRDGARLYAWYATLKVEAKGEMKRAMYLVHCLREDLTGKFRSKEKKAEARVSHHLSATEMRAKVNRNPKVRAAIELYMAAVTQYQHLVEYCEALTQRHRNLQSLNALFNSEYRQTNH